ncbi:DUF397 domain-containing protein [Streptomyces sp. AS02]|uniref:DUF397 domain-containing protein n=1 Tax=Streptomyces sp. AS02 TaxID=2938946 RepID=UPI002020029F|nr:DUF397 domain-containing protein [Streptomyces sp. AS02]MCL8016799.1 DUF397 domain-containing protein [Streptomyces sp. AS02]
MTIPDTWRKSSYSGSGDGNNCVEIANFYAQVAIRDSKAPAQGTLYFPVGAFIAFISNLHSDIGRDIEGP